MTHEASGYGLWTLVVLNSALFLMFAFSFFKPQSGRDWRTFGASHSLSRCTASRSAST
jgi:hypothetical protein